MNILNNFRIGERNKRSLATIPITHLDTSSLLEHMSRISSPEREREIAILFRKLYAANSQARVNISNFFQELGVMTILIGFVQEERDLPKWAALLDYPLEDAKPAIYDHAILKLITTAYASDIETLRNEVANTSKGTLGAKALEILEATEERYDLYTLTCRDDLFVAYKNGLDQQMHRGSLLSYPQAYTSAFDIRRNLGLFTPEGVERVLRSKDDDREFQVMKEYLNNNLHPRIFAVIVDGLLSVDLGDKYRRAVGRVILQKGTISTFRSSTFTVFLPTIPRLPKNIPFPQLLGAGAVPPLGAASIRNVIRKLNRFDKEVESHNNNSATLSNFAVLWEEFALNLGMYMCSLSGQELQDFMRATGHFGWDSAEEYLWILDYFCNTQPIEFVHKLLDNFASLTAANAIAHSLDQFWSQYKISPDNIVFDDPAELILALNYSPTADYYFLSSPSASVREEAVKNLFLPHFAKGIDAMFAQSGDSKEGQKLDLSQITSIEIFEKFLSSDNQFVGKLFNAIPNADPQVVESLFLTPLVFPELLKLATSQPEWLRKQGVSELPYKVESPKSIYQLGLLRLLSASAVTTKDFDFIKNQALRLTETFANKLLETLDLDPRTDRISEESLFIRDDLWVAYKRVSLARTTDPLVNNVEIARRKLGIEYSEPIQEVRLALENGSPTNALLWEGFTNNQLRPDILSLIMYAYRHSSAAIVGDIKGMVLSNGEAIIVKDNKKFRLPSVPVFNLDRVPSGLEQPALLNHIRNFASHTKKLLESGVDLVGYLNELDEYILFVGIIISDLGNDELKMFLDSNSPTLLNDYPWFFDYMFRTSPKIPQKVLGQYSSGSVWTTEISSKFWSAYHNADYSVVFSNTEVEFLVKQWPTAIDYFLGNGNPHVRLTAVQAIYRADFEETINTVFRKGATEVADRASQVAQVIGNLNIVMLINEVLDKNLSYTEFWDQIVGTYPDKNSRRWAFMQEALPLYICLALEEGENLDRIVSTFSNLLTVNEPYTKHTLWMYLGTLKIQLDGAFSLLLRLVSRQNKVETINNKEILILLNSSSSLQQINNFGVALGVVLSLIELVLNINDSEGHDYYLFLKPDIRIMVILELVFVFDLWEAPGFQKAIAYVLTQAHRRKESIQNRIKNDKDRFSVFEVLKDSIWERAREAAEQEVWKKSNYEKSRVEFTQDGNRRDKILKAPPASLPLPNYHKMAELVAELNESALAVHRPMVLRNSDAGRIHIGGEVENFDEGLTPEQAEFSSSYRGATIRTKMEKNAARQVHRHAARKLTDTTSLVYQFKNGFRIDLNSKLEQEQLDALARKLSLILDFMYKYYIDDYIKQAELLKNEKMQGLLRTLQAYARNGKFKAQTLIHFLDQNRPTSNISLAVLLENPLISWMLTLDNETNAAGLLKAAKTHPEDVLLTFHYMIVLIGQAFFQMRTDDDVVSLLSLNPQLVVNKLVNSREINGTNDLEDLVLNLCDVYTLTETPIDPIDQMRSQLRTQLGYVNTQLSTNRYQFDVSLYVSKYFSVNHPILGHTSQANVESYYREQLPRLKQEVETFVAEQNKITVDISKAKYRLQRILILQGLGIGLVIGILLAIFGSYLSEEQEKGVITEGIYVDELVNDSLPETLHSLGIVPEKHITAQILNMPRGFSPTQILFSRPWQPGLSEIPLLASGQEFPLQVVNTTEDALKLTSPESYVELIQLSNVLAVYGSPGYRVKNIFLLGGHDSKAQFDTTGEDLIIPTDLIGRIAIIEYEKDLEVINLGRMTVAFPVGMSQTEKREWQKTILGEDISRLLPPKSAVGYNNLRWLIQQTSYSIQDFYIAFGGFESFFVEEHVNHVNYSLTIPDIPNDGSVDSLKQILGLNAYYCSVASQGDKAIFGSLGLPVYSQASAPGTVVTDSAGNSVVVSKAGHVFTLIKWGEVRIYDDNTPAKQVLSYDEGIDTNEDTASTSEVDDLSAAFQDLVKNNRSYEENTKDILKVLGEHPLEIAGVLILACIVGIATRYRRKSKIKLGLEVEKLEHIVIKRKEVENIVGKEPIQQTELNALNNTNPAVGAEVSIEITPEEKNFLYWILTILALDEELESTKSTARFLQRVLMIIVQGEVPEEDMRQFQDHAIGLLAQRNIIDASQLSGEVDSEVAESSYPPHVMLDQKQVIQTLFDANLDTYRASSHIDQGKLIARTQLQMVMSDFLRRLMEITQQDPHNRIAAVLRYILSD